MHLCRGVSNVSLFPVMILANCRDHMEPTAFRMSNETSLYGSWLSWKSRAEPASQLFLIARHAHTRTRHRRVRAPRCHRPRTQIVFPLSQSVNVGCGLGCGGRCDLKAEHGARRERVHPAFDGAPGSPPSTHPPSQDTSPKVARETQRAPSVLAAQAGTTTQTCVPPRARCQPTSQGPSHVHPLQL